MGYKYYKLQNIVIDTFELDAPIEIEKGVLWLDDLSKQVLFQLKLNVLGVDTRLLSSVSLLIDCLDEVSEIIADISPFTFTYRDIFLNKSKTLGEDNPILLDQRVRRVIVGIQRVVFTDSTTWIPAGNQFTPPKQELIASLQPELVEQFQRAIHHLSPAVKESFIFLPKQLDDYWLCTCGRPNKNDAESCFRCGLSKESVFNVSPELLGENLEKYKERVRLEEEEARIASEKEKIEALEKAQKEEEEKKVRSKRLKAGLFITGIVGLIVALFFIVILPALKYTKASNYLANKDYNYAIYVFDSLGNYRNSEDMVSEANYQKANDFLNNKKYDDAIKTFSYIETYRDSSTMKLEVVYQKATYILENKNYDEAFILFSSLGDYRDSNLMAKESKFQKANELLSQREFDAARKIFIELGDYSSSVEMVKELDYQNANKLLLDSQFEEAIIILKRIITYKDSDKLLQETTYQLAVNLFTEEQYSESLDLFANLGDYKDSSSYLETINSELDRQKDLAKLRQMQISETIYQPSCQFGLLWLADNEFVIIEMIDNTVNVIKDGNKLVITRNNFSQAILADFSPDLQQVALVEEGVLKIWDINLGVVINDKILLPEEEWVYTWSPDGKMILTARSNEESGFIYSLWDLSTNSRVLSREDWFKGFSPDGKNLAIYNEGAVELWDVNTKTNRQLVKDLDSSSHGIFSPDWKYFAYFLDNEIAIWSVSSGSLIKNFSFAVSPSFQLAWSPDSTLLAVLSDDGLTVWNMITNSVESHKTNSDREIDSVTWSPDSTLLVTTTGYELTVWNMITNSVKLQINDVPGHAFLQGFSPDGLTIATASSGTDVITFWDLESGDPVKTLSGEFLLGWSPSGLEFAKYHYVDNGGCAIEIWEIP